MHKSYDLFISYRHSGSGSSDPDAVPNLTKALEEDGFEVFLDQTEISEFTSITKRVEESLANSKALLVYLSPDYFASRACQIEFTAAFIASFKERGKPEDRIFIINPSGKTDYLKKLPVELNDAKFAMTPEQALSVLPERLNNLNGTFKDLGLVARPNIYGASALNGYERFSGRIEDMWKIHSGLNASGCSMVTGHVSSDTVILRGLGGIGKSLLAEEYAIRFSSAYPGGIYWLKAYGSYNPENPDIEGFKASCTSQFRQIAHFCKIKTDDKMDLAYLRALVGSHIEQIGEKCLWVVDDIPQGLSEYVDDIKNWFGPYPLAKTLVTTRSREYANLGKEHMLDVLNKDSALEILYKHDVDIEREKSDAEKLVDEILGLHSLAVDISGAAINNIGMSINEYLKEIQCGAGDILLEMPGELVNALPNGHETSIVKTISRSINKLPEKSGGLDFLRLAANIYPATITNNLIKKVFEIIFAPEVNSGARLVRTAPSACLKYSLAMRDDEGWSVHTLISATVRYLGYSQDDKGKRIRQATLEVLQDLIRSDLDYEKTMKIMAEVEHAKHLTKVIDGIDELILSVIIADFESQKGNLFVAVDEWMRICIFLENRFGADNSETLAAKNRLALAKQNAGDLHTAKKIHEYVYERRRLTLGEDDPDTLTSMHNLAIISCKLGEDEEAKKLLEMVVSKRKAVLGSDNSDTISSIKDLKAIKMKLVIDNNTSKPTPLNNDIPDINEVNEQYEDLRSMVNRAYELRATGNLRGAYELLDSVYAAREKNLGIDHHETLKTQSNLGVVIGEMGDYERAKNIQENVLERLSDIFQPDHPDIIDAKTNLAYTLGKLGNYARAKTLLAEAHESSIRTFGIEHHFTLTSKKNLVFALLATGDYDGAKRLEKQIVEYSKRKT